MSDTGTGGADNLATGAAAPGPCAPGAVLSVPLTETSPGTYETWWTVPADLPAGVYDVVGCLTVGGEAKAATPPAVLIILSSPAGAQTFGPLPPQNNQPGPVQPSETPPPVPQTAAEVASSSEGPSVTAGALTSQQAQYPAAPGGDSGLPSAPTWAAAPTRNVPAGELWVTPDDYIVLGIRAAIGGVALTLGARMWSPSGDFVGGSMTVTPPSDRSLNFYTLPLSYGYLTGVSVGTVSGNVARGQLFAQVLIARGPTAAFIAYATLFQGYISTTARLGWPPGTLEDPTDGRGFPKRITVGSPQAGADWQLVVPSFTRWRVMWAQGALAASTQAGTRTLGMAFFPDAQSIGYFSLSAVTLAANTSNEFYWLPRGTADQTLAVKATAGMSYDPYMRGGGIIQSYTNGIQTNDQWSSVEVGMEEWFDA